MAMLTACGSRNSGPGPAAQHPLFREVAAETGLQFSHFTGATGEFYLPEIMGSGVALVDYDGDGDLDVYILQGRLLDPRKGLTDALFPPPAGWKAGNRLFRNELIPSGKLHFTDVTEQAGLGHAGYDMGVAVGDYDNDGYPDLYVTGFGANVLYHNNRNGTFTDVTRAAGIKDEGWSTSAAFVDYDRDGYLDLFVTHYVDFDIARKKECRAQTGGLDYCSPSEYRPLVAKLFHNERNGKFVDVTRTSGIGSLAGPGLGVVCADFNGDGWIDIYVANDGAASYLWLNQGNGTFKEVALESGTAYSSDGKSQAGMGLAAGDYDNDGSEDIFKTNLLHEQFNLYHNDGHGFFSDAAAQVGLGQATHPYTGFGTGWIDYDNDGWLDLFVANGSVSILESRQGVKYPYCQAKLLFHNESGKHFRDTTASAGPGFGLCEVSRGVAFGDIDNDGDIDVVVSNNNGPTRLFLNQTGSEKHWLQVRLEGTRSNRLGLGARVAVMRKRHAPLWRRAHSDGSYLSASDVRVHFGLSGDPDVTAVVVVWPDGSREIWHQIQTDRIITLRQGTGQQPGD